MSLHAADAVALESLVGRIVHKYFEGYGNFLGLVVRKVPDRPVVEVDYEDGTCLLSVVCVPPFNLHPLSHTHPPRRIPPGAARLGGHLPLCLF